MVSLLARVFREQWTFFRCKYGMRKCVKKDAIVSIASGDSNQSYTSLYTCTWQNTGRYLHVHVDLVHVIILVAINLRSYVVARLESTCTTIYSSSKSSFNPTKSSALSSTLISRSSCSSSFSGTKAALDMSTRSILHNPRQAAGSSTSDK